MRIVVLLLSLLAVGIASLVFLPGEHQREGKKDQRTNPAQPHAARSSLPEASPAASPLFSDSSQAPATKVASESSTERSARLMRTLEEQLSLLSEIPPPEEELETFLKALFEESGLQPDDVHGMLEALADFFIKGNDDEFAWDRAAQERAFAIEVLLGVAHQNRQVPGFEAFVGEGYSEELVATILEVYELLHGEAQLHLAQVMSAAGGMLAPQHEDMLEKLMALDPLPPGLELLLASYGRTPEERDYLGRLASEHSHLLKSATVRGVLIAKALEGAPPEQIEQVAAAFLDDAPPDVKRETIKGLGSLPPASVVTLARITHVAATAGDIVSQSLIHHFRRPLFQAVNEGRFSVEAMQESFLEVSRDENPVPLQDLHIGVMQLEHVPLLEWILGFDETREEFGIPPRVDDEVRLSAVLRLTNFLPGEALLPRHADEIRPFLASADDRKFQAAWAAAISFVLKRGTDDSLADDLRRICSDRNLPPEQRKMIADLAARFLSEEMRKNLGID